jgi:hypothetical protein
MSDIARSTNAHTHSCDALRLENWLNAVWARLDHLSPEEIWLAVTLGTAQMLKQGVTASPAKTSWI